MDIINKLYEDSNRRHDAIAQSLQERTTVLHEKLLSEVRALGHDTMSNEFRASDDPMVAQSKQIMVEDIAARQKAGGPSIRRYKFQVPYWNYWHSEKTLLDQISRERHAQLELERASKPVVNTKALLARKRKERAAFTKGNKFFDRHLLAETNVPFILKTALQQEIPPEETLDPSFNAVFNTRSTATGGAFHRDQRFSRGQLHSETRSCDVPPLPSSFDTDGLHKQGFSTAKRFSAPLSASAPAAPTTYDDPSSRVVASVITGREGYTFSQAARGDGGGEAGARQVGGPGPAAYQLPRLFDTHPSPAADHRQQLQALLEKYQLSLSSGMHDWEAEELCGLAKLGQGCDVEQHVLFGMCRDKQCLRRALFERGAIAAQDRVRLRGYRPADFLANEARRAEKARLRGKYKYPASVYGREEEPEQAERKDSAEDVYLAAAWPLLAAPVYAMTPLYSAVVLNDLATIKTLGEMRVNPNTAQPDTGYTPLHIGAIKKHHKAVYYLLHYFHNEAVVAERDHAKCWLQLNARDLRGNTALHYASRLGCQEVVAMLCQEKGIDPLVKNNNGETPLDLIGNHAVYSYLQLAIQRTGLEEEIRQAKARSRSSLATTTTTATTPVQALRSRSSSKRST